ncbi:MAG: N-acetyl sugar amidotransferase [Pseudomonadota bacterium]|nr:N-acetyl sugar amidotransferase [Pseudomonadota bacterium]
MVYCKRCLYPLNHPFGIILDSEGVCSGCRVHEEKDALDWEKRFKKLEHIVHSNAKVMRGREFDCIVPITGGGDSFFIVHTVKNVLGMNPLLIHYNSHYNTKIGIRNLANLATVFDCDVVTSTLSPTLLKRLTRSTLLRFGSMYWQVLAGNLTFPVQAACRFRTPLIIWGVHPWSDQTGMFSHLHEVEMTERCRKEHGLFGVTAEDLIDEEAGITRADIQPFVYPYDNELELVGVRGIYLSNYIRWDSKAQHEQMIDLYGYEAAAQQRTFNTYEDVHCFHSAGLHDYLKYLKLGYSKVTDHATREIRLRRMSREEGIDMVRQYNEVEPTDLPLFLDWVEMGRKEFMDCVWGRRDSRIWNKSADGSWVLLDSILNHREDLGINEVQLQRVEDCQYRLTPTGEPNAAEDNYLLMGRGYFDKYNFGAQEDNPDDGGLTSRAWQKPRLIE